MDLFTIAQVPGTDITNYFEHGAHIPACLDTGNSIASQFKAVTFDPCSKEDCVLGTLSQSTFDKLKLVNTTRLVGYDWTQLASPNLTHYFVIDGTVLNIDPYINAYPEPVAGDALDTVIRSILNSSFAEGGRDGTKQFFRHPELKASINCLINKYRAGYIDKTTPGCFAASLVLFFALAVVLSIVLARFFMALIFAWCLSWKMSRTPPSSSAASIARYSHARTTMEMADIKKTKPPAVPRLDSGTTLASFTDHVGNDLYTVLLITCYSEGLDGIRATVESLSKTDYPDERKLLFLIADGLITGSGEKISTPDICLSLMTFDRPEFRNPEPMPYIAVADGAKQYNRAKVYAGHYGKRKGKKWRIHERKLKLHLVCKGHKVPMILVVKCGNPDEEGKPKPGNRGKRDSQLILMNFFSRVTYNDRMTPLDYDLFRKVQYLMGVTPDYFELVLMVRHSEPGKRV